MGVWTWCRHAIHCVLACYHLFVRFFRNSKPAIQCGICIAHNTNNKCHLNERIKAPEGTQIIFYAYSYYCVNHTGIHMSRPKTLRPSLRHSFIYTTIKWRNGKGLGYGKCIQNFSRKIGREEATSETWAHVGG